MQYLTGIKYRHLIDNGFINLSLSRNFVDYDTQQHDSLLVPVYLNKSKEKENTFNAELTYKLSNKSDITIGGDVKLIDFSANILLPKYTTTFGDSLQTYGFGYEHHLLQKRYILNYNTVFFG